MDGSKSFKICSDYKRVNFDFNDIQNDRNNRLDNRGRLMFPYLLPSSHGSSFTLKLSDSLFFKRKQQDGNLPAEIFSQHHFRKDYAELSGSLDDLAEVICYHLSKNIVDPATQEPLVKVAKYALASYVDEEGIEFRGCVTENVAENNEQFISMADIFKSALGANNPNDKSIAAYINALAKYTSLKSIKFDKENIQRELLKNSYFCWKVANSDNHKNNITFLIKKDEKENKELVVSPMIDNGSAYELSAPYVSSKDPDKLRFEYLLEIDELSSEVNGERVLDFDFYPFMHNAFVIDTDNLNVESMHIGDKQYAYEYGLAAFMLSDNEFLRQIYEIEKQFDIDKAVSEINTIYGNDKVSTINWPPLLIDFMKATNKVKSQTLSYVTNDLYFQNAIRQFDGLKQNANFETIKNEFLKLPLMQSKEEYDRAFLDIFKRYGISLDLDKLKQMSVYKLGVEKEKI